MNGASARWLRGASSLVVVVVITAAWIAVSLWAPDAMAWFVPDPLAHGATEGPIDWLENVLLPLVILLWLGIASRHRADRVRLTLALLMALQFAFILGEEVDWGQTLGLRPMGTWRNVRMVLRDMGVLQRWDDALVPTAYFLFFVLAPLVPLTRMQRWLERTAPVRAERGDGVAVALLPPSWIAVSELVVPQKSVELIQLCAYTITLGIAIRILRAPRATTA